MLTRVLPGGVMVAAALTVPEFSVGAGDLGRSPTPLDPPEPAAKPDPSIAKRAATSTAPTHPKLAGVRYAPIIDLGTDKARAAAVTAEAMPAGRAAAAPSAFDAAFADLAATPPAPLAAPAGSAPAIAAEPASAPVAAPARAVAAPQTVPAATPAALSAQPAAVEPPSRPAAVASETSAFASLLPEEQAALRAPVSATPPSAPLAASQPAPLAASMATPAVAAPAARPAAAPVATQPPARGMIEQVTPARIAVARPAAAPVAPASAPAKAPARIVAVSTPAPAAVKPAPVAAAPAKSAPAPAAAAAAVPRQAAALTAPASAGAQRIADLEFRDRLLTRVDGRAKGQVDFQQTPTGLKVRLGSVAELLADRIAPADLARIRNSSSGNAWLSLAEFQAQGIPISYDPVYDEFNIGREDTRPKVARKVHMDQISAPERSAGAAAMDQIPRRR